MIYALLLFVPTLYFGVMPMFLIAIAYSIYKKRSIEITAVFKLLAIITLLSVVNFFFALGTGNIHYEYSGSFLAAFPYAIFLIPTYLIANSIDDNTLKWLLYLIVFEIFIGIAEYLTDTTSFFTSSDQEDLFSSSFLYGRRVLGLSSNSSAFAEKILLGLMILFSKRSKFSRKYFSIIFLFILVGLYITFNRTVIICALFLMVYFVCSEFHKSKIITIVFLLSVFLALFFMKDKILYQFLRGYDGSSVDLSLISSGRDSIYPQFWNFFKAHPLCGNGSSKLWIMWDGKSCHAHNSYLMTLASNGLLISFFYFFIPFFNFSRKTFPYILVYLISGLFQYSIFWGISLNDIMLIYFILSGTDSKRQNRLLPSTGGGQQFLL